MSSNRSLLSWILASQFAAILVVCSKLTIPLGPIPLTGQTLAVGIIASLLASRTGQKAIFLYLLLGLIGLPVFAGSATSLAALFGPTAGYLWGFFAYVSLTMVVTKSSKNCHNIVHRQSIWIYRTADYGQSLAHYQ